MIQVLIIFKLSTTVQNPPRVPGDICPRATCMHACAVNVARLILMWFLKNAHRKPRSLYSTGMSVAVSQSSYEK